MFYGIYMTSKLSFLYKKQIIEFSITLSRLLSRLLNNQLQRFTKHLDVNIFVNFGHL